MYGSLDVMIRFFNAENLEHKEVVLSLAELFDSVQPGMVPSMTYVSAISRRSIIIATRKELAIVAFNEDFSEK